jgi:hypothetical protein
MAPHPREALKESAKIDAEYNLPTWIPKKRVNMTKHSGNTQGTHREHSKYIQETLSENPENIQGTLRDVQCTLSEHSVNIQGTLRNVQ